MKLPTMAMRAVPSLLLLVAVVASSTALSTPTAASVEQSPATVARAEIVLQKATISMSTRGTIVTLEASARLPPPVVGTLDDPPRIFLDFYGVRPAVRNARATGNGVASAVRFVLNSEEPPLTRVFIDLHKMTPYVIESVQGDQARLRIVLSATDTAARSDGTRSSTPPEPPASGRPTGAARSGERPRQTTGTDPDPPKASASDLRSYRAQAVESLQRLIDLRPLLASIDRRTAVSRESLELAVEEFRDIRAAVLALDAPQPLRATHDVLLRACALALQAASTRLEATRTANTSTEWNAASAAAGAIMLIDRARAELRLEPRKH